MGEVGGTEQRQIDAGTRKIVREKREAPKPVTRNGIADIPVYVHVMIGNGGAGNVTDAIRVQQSSLPGGAATDYNLGETATHEAGHWLGPHHTFRAAAPTRVTPWRGTPAQDSPSTGCPTGRDSCPGSGARSDPQLHGSQLLHDV